MQTGARQRNEVLDIAKGIGIIGVVVCHSGVLQNFTTFYNQVIFFFISGYLYKEAYTADPWALIKSRVRTLYIPFIRYGLFFGVLHNLLFKVHIYSEQVQSQFNQVAYLGTRDYLLNLLRIASFAKVEQILAPMWFLPVLFIVNVLFVLCAYTLHTLKVPKQDRWLAVIMAAVFFAGFYFNPGRNLALRPVSIAMVTVVMFYLGYIWKRHEAKIRFTAPLAAVCLILLVAGVPYGPINTGAHQLVSPPFFLVISLAGIYLCLYAADQAKRATWLRNFLIVAGRNTIAIMALQFLAFRAVNFIQASLDDLPADFIAKHPYLSNSGGWWVLYIAAGVGLPMLGKLIYEKIMGYFRPRQQPMPA